jgi:hypothetical protein
VEEDTVTKTGKWVKQLLPFSQRIKQQQTFERSREEFDLTKKEDVAFSICYLQEEERIVGAVHELLPLLPQNVVCYADFNVKRVLRKGNRPKNKVRSAKR